MHARQEALPLLLGSLCLGLPMGKHKEWCLIAERCEPINGPLHLAPAGLRRHCAWNLLFDLPWQRGHPIYVETFRTFLPAVRMQFHISRSHVDEAWRLGNDDRDKVSSEQWSHFTTNKLFTSLSLSLDSGYINSASRCQHLPAQDCGRHVSRRATMQFIQ